MRRMNQTGRRGLVAALEEETQGEAEELKVIEAPALPEHADSFETDMVDLANQCADLDSLHAAADETAEVGAALEQIAVCLGESAKVGGIDRHSAQAVGIAVDTLYKRVGITKKSFPAMESFGGTSTRARATKIAMEELNEQLKKIWEAIIAAYKHAVEWVVGFYNKVTDAAGKMGERAEALKKHVGEMKAGEAGEKEIANDRVAKALGSSKSLDESIKAMLEVAQESASGAILQSNLEVGKEALASLSSAGEAVSKFKMVGISLPGTKSTEGVPEGFEAVSSPEMPGHMHLVVVVPTKDLEGDAAVEGLAHFKYELKGAGAEGEAKALPTLDVPKMTALCEDTAKLSEILVKGKEGMEKINEIKKELLAKAESLGKAAAALAADSPDAKGFHGAQKIAQGYARLADQPRVMMMGYLISTGKAMLDYVELSVKAHAPKKEEAAPAAEEPKEGATKPKEGEAAAA